jgi:serine/threonine-protein kinase
VAEKYVVERTLGVGGMGVVVAARDRLLDRRVAIKFLLPKLAGSDTAVQRFVREARAATRISSEHVVRLLEIEKLPDGTPFFVMEYLEGSDLRAVLRDRGVLSPSLAVDYVLQAAQAVAEGHVKGVVHRDIKPSNLFLTRRADGTALIKVLDFGIAKTTESEQPESSALTSSEDVRLGSPAYSSPEQLQNPRDVDKRSDIWSLGATLYELLCGRPPFEGNGYLELATRILKDPPTPISSRDLPRTLPSGLEKVLRKCLEKERSRRYANAAELAAALAPFGSDDARVSLTRVSGMLASQSSFPALTSAIPAEHATDLEPTLDVAGEAGRDRRSSNPGSQRRTSQLGAIASEPPPAGKRSWVVIGVAVAAIATVLALRAPTAPMATAPNVAAQPAMPAVEAPAPVAAPLAEPTPVVAKAPEVVKPAATVGSAATPPVSEKSKRAEVVAKPAGAAMRDTQSASMHLAVPAAPEGDTSAPHETAPSAQPAPQSSAGSSLGRSSEIERLIDEGR